jgi:hypothetical protein
MGIFGKILDKKKPLKQVKNIALNIDKINNIAFDYHNKLVGIKQFYLFKKLRGSCGDRLTEYAERN